MTEQATTPAAFKAANFEEYGPDSRHLNWITPETAARADQRRTRLIEKLETVCTRGASGTKIDMENLSPGCRVCVSGGWSCLFINGICNGTCFYCPAPQNDPGDPVTQTIPFTSPDDYADYVERFGFTGVSISGGEPFLSFEKSRDYIRAVRERMGKDLHIWLYTNGTRVTREKLKSLREAGLDEIRFDIGAVDYDLSYAALAADLIPVVTVEIPAVPEDLPRLKGLAEEMVKTGIRHLNLHQLRLTPHNLPRLAARPYTFVHGEKVTVLESELAALEMIEHVKDRGIDLPVNYCSFVYKYRFQRAAARRVGGSVMGKSYERVTDSGYIRSLRVTPADPDQAVAALAAAGAKESSDWMLDAGKNLFVAPEFLQTVAPFAGNVSADYFEALLRPSISYFHPFQSIHLAGGKTIYAERHRVQPETALPAASASALFSGSPDRLPDDTGIRDCLPWEQIPSGLGPY